MENVGKYTIHLEWSWGCWGQLPNIFVHISLGRSLPFWMSASSVIKQYPKPGDALQEAGAWQSSRHNLQVQEVLDPRKSRDWCGRAYTLGITFLRAAHISANTITPGGATGSAASPSTVAVTGAQTTRSAATPGELQAVPPKPLLLVQQFGQCQHGDQRGRSSFSPYLLK